MNNNGFHFFIFYIFCTTIVLSFFFCASASEQNPYSILYVDSYAPGMSFSEQELLGFKETIQEKYQRVDLRIEYLDTKKVFDKPYFEHLASLYAHKYQNSSFDVIITADNSAFDFIRTYRSNLFPHVPIVFLGVNFFSDDMIAGESDITGIVQDNDIVSTISVAKTQFPDITRVYLIHDQSDTGLAIRTHAETSINALPPSVSLSFLTNMTISELIQSVQDLPDDSIVLLDVFNRDMAGNLFTHEEIADIISNNSPNPVYVNSESMLNHGVVGGIITTGYEHGKIAGILTSLILDGKPVSSIPVIYSTPKTPIFDYQVLRKFNISQKSLPYGSVIINRPESATIPIWLFYTTITIIVFCCIIIVILLYHIRMKKRVEGKLRQTISEKERAEELLHTDEARLEGLLRIHQYPYHSYQGFLDYTLKECVELTSSKSGYIVRFCETSNDLEIISKYPDESSNIGSAKHNNIPFSSLGKWGDMIMQNLPVIMNNPNHHNREFLLNNHLDQKINRFLSIPVVVKGKIELIIGVVNKDEDYDESDIRQLTLMMEAVFQIADRRKTIELLIEKTNFLEDLIRYANIPIVIWDKTLLISDVNNSFTLLSEYMRDELVRIDIDSFLFTLYPEISKEEISKFKKEYSLPLEVPLVTKSGKNKNLIWNTTVIKDNDGHIQAIILMGLDITEKRMLEHERRTLMVQIEKNLAEMAILNDGIRNPLTIISTILEMSEENLFPRIWEEIDRIDQMVNQLDTRWMESEKIISYLNRHHGITLNVSQGDENR